MLDGAVSEQFCNVAHTGLIAALLLSRSVSPKGKSDLGRHDARRDLGRSRYERRRGEDHVGEVGSRLRFRSS